MVDFSKIFQLECPLVSDSTLMEIARTYILKNFWSDHFIGAQNSEVHLKDEIVVKRLQELFNNSNHRLRMYGSAEELVHNLKIFRNFQSSHSKFKMNKIEPWNTKSTLYSGTDGKQYVSKHDLFVLIQNLAINSVETVSENLVALTFFIVMKMHWEKIKDCIEFVSYDQSLFDEFATEFLDFFNEFRNSQSPDYDFKIDTGTVEETVSQWKSLFGNNCIGVLAASIYKEIPSKHHQEVWKTSFRWVKALIESLEKVIAARPFWFLPSEEKFNRKLRLFEDYGHKFVLVLEVCNAGGMEMVEKFENSRYISNYDGSVEVNGFFTIDLKTFKSILGKELENLIFIKTPVIRAKHAAVPISFTNEEDCTLASDVLFELLRELILGHKLFQRAENEKKEGLILKRIFIEILNKYFHVPEVHFFNPSAVETIRSDFQSHISKVKRSVLKDVRNAKKDGFDLQNLKNELVHLSLHFEFPDIGDYAEMVYKRIDYSKSREFLRTCDLYDAVEQCQLICIMKEHEKLAAYIHNQKSCHRVWTSCKFCQTHKNTKWNRFLLKDVKLIANKVKNSANRSSLDQQMVLPNGVTLESNYDWIVACNDGYKEHMKNETDFYLIDVKDVKHLTTVNNSYHKYLRESMEVRPQRKIYLRTFSATVFKEEANSRVFVDEVFDIIRVILQQQEIDIESLTDKVNKYCEKWEESNILKLVKQAVFFETMSLDELKEVLEDFNIDKRLITIVPDIGYCVSVMFKMPLDMSDSIMSIRSPKLFHLVQDASQSILQIFQSVICYLDRSIECPQHGDHCKLSIMNEILLFIDETHSNGKGNYYRSDTVTNKIKKIKNHCFFKLQTTQKRIMDKYYSTHFKQSISLYDYILDFQALKFDSHNYEKSDQADQLLQNSYIAAWRARFLILFEISGRFFHKDNEMMTEYKHRMWEGINFKLPFLDWTDQSDFPYVLWGQDKSKMSWAETLWFAEPCEIDKLASHEWLIHNKNERDKIIKQRKKGNMGRSYNFMEDKSIRLLHSIRSSAVMKRIKRQETEKQELKENEKESVLKDKEKEEIAESKPEWDIFKKEVPKKRIIESTDRATSPIDFICQPCIDNKETLQKLNEKLDYERNSINTLNERVTTNENQILNIIETCETEKREQERKKIEISEKEMKINSFEKKLITQQKGFQELDKVKKELARKQEKLNGLKSQMIILDINSKESISQLQKQKVELEMTRISKKETVNKLERDIQKCKEEMHPYGGLKYEEVLDRQQQIGNNIASCKYENQQLHETIKVLENTNHEYERVNNCLLEQLASSSKLNLNDQPSTSSCVPQPHPTELSITMRNMLKLLEDKKATLMRGHSLEKARELAQRLMLSTDDEKTKTRVIEKLRVFQDDLNFYINILNHNITSIQSGYEDSMAELPQLPTFTFN